MLLEKQSYIFKPNFSYWRMLGIWPGREPSNYYKYYSIIFLSITLIIYILLQTISLLYTSLKMEILVQEVMFFFTAINIIGKVRMALILRDKIIDAMNLLDSGNLSTDDEESKESIMKANTNYNLYWKVYKILALISFCSQVIGVPLVLVVKGSEVGLPVCNYYFLNEDLKNRLFKILYFYQSFGIYCHMMYNVSVDTFITGTILLAITQFRVLNRNISKLKIDDESSDLKIEEQEKIQIIKLNRCLRRYDLIVQYCSTVQSIISTCMFVQYGISSVNICIALCGLMMIPSTESFIFSVAFNVVYLMAIVSAIFVPGWLGTILSYESQQLVFASYQCEWTPRSEPFKRSLKLFMERANTPVQLTGLNMFHLSLDTFISIMKTAYSFFTLLRFVLGKNISSQ